MLFHFLRLRNLALALALLASAAQPVVVRPMPLGPCKIALGCVLLPLVVTP